MTAEELRRKFNESFEIDKWPDHYEVDADTYANVCQHILDHYGEIIEDGVIELYGGVKRMTLSVGINNGVLFKGVELILKDDKPTELLTLEDIKVLYALLSNQYINYENEAAILLVRKISKMLNGV